MKTIQSGCLLWLSLAAIPQNAWANNPPQVSIKQTPKITEDSSKRFYLRNFSISDPDSTSWSLHMKSPPAGAPYTLVNQYTVVPNANHYQDFDVAYYIRDNQGAETHNTFRVDMIEDNKLPSLAKKAGQNYSINEDGSRRYYKSMFEVTDPDNDSVAFYLEAGSYYSLVNNYTVRPEADHDKDISVKYRLVDGRGATVKGSFSVAINPQDDPPNITPPSYGPIVSGETLGVYLRDFAIADIDSTSFALALLPAENQSDYTFTNNIVVPAADFRGTLVVRYRLTDNGGHSSEHSFTVSVVDNPIVGETTHNVLLNCFRGDNTERKDCVVAQGTDILVRWNTTDDFNGFSFDGYALTEISPIGTKVINANAYPNLVYTVNTENSEAGEYCYELTAIYKSKEGEPSKTCITLVDANLFQSGDTENASILDPTRKWNAFYGVHAGDKDPQGSAIVVATPIRDVQINENVHKPNTEAYSQEVQDAYVISGDKRGYNYGMIYDFCADAELRKKVFEDAEVNQNKFKSHWCKKSELSYLSANYTDQFAGLINASNTYAYEFTVNDIFSSSSCPDESVCRVFLSQFHTSRNDNLYPLAHLSPNNAIALEYTETNQGKILSLVFSTKVDCRLRENGLPPPYCVGQTIQELSCPGEACKKWAYIEIGRKVGIAEDIKYQVKLDILWATDETGRTRASIRTTDSPWETFASHENIATKPEYRVSVSGVVWEDWPLNYQTGLYWTNSLETDHIYKPNGSPTIQVTLDNIWGVRSCKHLPDVFDDRSVSGKGVCAN